MTKFPSSDRIFPYRPACVLRVSGPDASSFLQGQFTNDLGKIDAGESRYGLWLDRKGRVLADSQVIRSAADGFWIVSAHGAASLISRRLEDHMVADEVTVEDVTADWRAVSLLGSGSGKWFRSETRPGLLFPGRRGGLGSWEWLFEAADGPSADAALAGAAEAGFEELERMRIAAGIPRIPDDIGPADLPNEGGLEADAISYSKGCYLGQEVMARIKALGRVRRRLRRVELDGPRPATPATLWSGGRKEGELRSCVSRASGAGGEGLALLGVSCPAGTRLALSAGADASIRVLDGPESV